MHQTDIKQVTMYQTHIKQQVTMYQAQIKQVTMYQTHIK